MIYNSIYSSLIILIILGCAQANFAFTDEKRIIKGRLIESLTKEPVIGADIIEFDNENNKTTSDQNGEFILKFDNAIKFIEIKGMHLHQIAEVSNQHSNEILVEWNTYDKARKIRNRIKKKIKF